VISNTKALHSTIYFFFSKLSYTNGEIYNNSFNVWFNGSDWTGELIPAALVQFYQFTTFTNGTKVTVIAIRGSFTELDWIVDLNLFQASILLQLGGFIAPVINFWPLSLSSTIIELLSLQDRISTGLLPSYYTVVEEFVRDAGLEHNTILVGHSLGGAVAAIVGARLDMPALAFSGPGILKSYQKFGITDPDLIYKNVVNIRPTNDLIPRIDEIGGLIQDIICNDTVINCHKLRLTGCELLKACGDPLNRAFTYCINPT